MIDDDDTAGDTAGTAGDTGPASSCGHMSFAPDVRFAVEMGHIHYQAGVPQAVQLLCLNCLRSCIVTLADFKLLRDRGQIASVP